MKKIILLVIGLYLIINQGCEVVPFKDFDVASYTFDPNPFPLNPKWGKQVEQHQLPTPSLSCPINSDNPTDWTSSSKYPNCTKVPVYYNSGTWCGPHANFMPVTYTGVVTWEGHSNSVWDDDDYYMGVERNDSALYTSVRDQIHIEFNSDETVDNWDDTHTWWDDFHHNAVDDNDEHAHSMIDGDSVIIIGLLGLDVPHDGFAELHPVFAMFVHLQNDNPQLSNWAFFVRNWGDEGFCGGYQENLYKQTIKINIPNAVNCITNNIWEGAENEDNLSSMGVSIQPSNGGMLLTFNLLQPEKQSWFVGDLSFKTNTSVVGIKTIINRNAFNETEKNPYTNLEEKINRLSDSSKKQLYAGIYNLIPKMKPVQVKPSILTTPTKLEDAYNKTPVQVKNTNLVRQVKDTAQLLLQAKKIEFAKKYFEQRSE